MAQNPDDNLDSGTETIDTRILLREKSVASRCVAGETLIVPVRRNVGDLCSIYSFNEVGSLIWQLLEIPRNFSDLVSAVIAEYAVDRVQAQADISKFLDDMLSVGLVTVNSMHTVGPEERVGRGLPAAVDAG